MNKTTGTIFEFTQKKEKRKEKKKKLSSYWMIVPNFQDDTLQTARDHLKKETYKRILTITIN